jgi:uncharacterized protein (DUF952 family)
MPESVIYHIADQNHWEQAQTSGVYAHPTLHSEGFIHCSLESQLESTANLYFSSNEEILVLYIDPSKVESEIHYEPSTRGEEYPHIYGPVNIESVTRSRKIRRRADGRYKIKV